jgi:hypothetical protein
MLLAYFHIYKLAPGSADKDTEKSQLFVQTFKKVETWPDVMEQLFNGPVKGGIDGLEEDRRGPVEGHQVVPDHPTDTNKLQFLHQRLLQSNRQTFNTGSKIS